MTNENKTMIEADPLPKIKDKIEVDHLPEIKTDGPGAVMTIIERMAMMPELDMDRLERMFDMHKELMALDAEKLFNQALAETQRNLQVVVANMYNVHTKKKYADLAAIHAKCKPVWTSNGLSASSIPAKSETENYIKIITTIRHQGGHKVEFSYDYPLDIAGSGGKINKTTIQGMGSSIEYGRRYHELAFFDIPIEGKDNDGNTKPEKINPGEQPLTRIQIDTLRQAMIVANVDDKTMCKKAQIDKVEELPQARLAGCITWLKKRAQS